METQDNQQYIIYADPSKCKGCKKCEIACMEAHYDLTKKEIIKNRKQLTPRIKVYKSGDVKMPIQCRQCANAPCARVCPTKAIVREAGMVRVRHQYCVGCKMCVMVCPFGAIAVAEKDPVFGDVEPEKTSPAVALKCDLCEEWRKKNGKETSACAEACKFGALRFVTVDQYRELKMAKHFEEFQGATQSLEPETPKVPAQ
ncbi:4Fe-4S dicluster domain-containing protein [Desulfobaculum bizertense]|uniref:Carbon-monoxide dehydrogenase iron sulfur subunit n=1 Tax=Desulfobaculum bizertense DSM 18034 TaxID=1121442 RepID=A0A1T4VT13_9BACT|nr:4Fe-4S dicluster domain-containing protein [Desulfobaculum bizertense]UIJ38436.1 4Fe-4S dicluster domain-containing protein [Desulfobaculum bizertense]SKA68132.1 carbon-monoxide dehydrogenase iron sulfur subunit [Desulfobaculum bizertense DSM 18034]